jgi:hypothetical protein
MGLNIVSLTTSVATCQLVLLFFHREIAHRQLCSPALPTQAKKKKSQLTRRKIFAFQRLMIRAFYFKKKKKTGFS